MKTLLLLAWVSLFPEVQHFKDVAEFTVAELKAENIDSDWLLNLHQELSKTGTKILNHYQARHPDCGAQLELLMQDLPSIESRPIAEIIKIYHDGLSLPEAPRHCIYGRVYLVHPIVNSMKIKAGINSESRLEMIADLEELLKYLPNLQKNLEVETLENEQ